VPAYAHHVAIRIGRFHWCSPLKSLFDGIWPEVATGEVDLNHPIDLVVRGGWPGAIDLSAEQASAIAFSYLEAILNDDVRKVDGIKRDANKMKLLLHSLARNESTLASKKSLSDGIIELGVTSQHRLWTIT